jgi:Tol biopolymer transport system component
MPDGRSIAVIGNGATFETVRVTEVDIATGRESILYTSTDGKGIPDWRMGFALGPNGRSFILNLQTPGGPAELVRVTLPAGELTRLTNDLAMYFGAGRVGEAIVTSRYEQRTSLWVADAAGQGARQIGREMSASVLKGIAWAGTRILFSASIAGSAGVWSTDIGSGASQLVAPAEAWSRFSTTADGRTLYFARGAGAVWTSGTDGSHLAKVPNAGSTEPVVTPDGSLLMLTGSVLDLKSGARRKLAAPGSSHDSSATSMDGRFLTYESGGEQVIEPVTAGGPVRRVKVPRQAGSVPHFTPDGQGLAYVDRTGLAIWIQPIGGGAPRQLVGFPDRPIIQFAWSPDGKQLAVSRAMTVSDVVLLRGVRP